MVVKYAEGEWGGLGFRETMHPPQKIHKKVH